MMEDQHLHINFGARGLPRGLDCAELTKISIAAWSHTAMVAGTLCLLESLDPIEAAALKMSTCFMGPFTLPDLAASNCSQWGGAAYFDLLRLFRAVWKLETIGILEKVNSNRPARTSVKSANNEMLQGQFGDNQYFQVQNMLVRAVGASMVLEGQKKAVKRNALINRVLINKLPARMAALVSEKSIQHIPWYYEQAMRRMK